MHAELIVLRLLHVVLGVYWVGTVVFLAVFLEPSIRGAGPAGGQVMQGLAGRHFMEIMPAVALLAVLSGLRLFALDAAGAPDFMRSRGGMAFTTGAVAALIGFGIGVFVMRPAIKRAMAIGPDPARQAEAQVFRRRAALAGRVVAALLTIAAGAMSIARYL